MRWLAYSALLLAFCSAPTTEYVSKEQREALCESREPYPSEEWRRDSRSRAETAVKRALNALEEGKYGIGEGSAWMEMKLALINYCNAGEIPADFIEARQKVYQASMDYEMNQTRDKLSKNDRNAIWHLYRAKQFSDDSDIPLPEDFESLEEEMTTFSTIPLE